VKRNSVRFIHHLLKPIFIVYLKCVGGEVTPPAVLAPKCGTLGVNPKQVGEAIQKATMDWRGIKVQVEVAVENRVATVSIVPTAAPLIIKALKEGPRDRKKTKNVKHNGNLKLDEIVAIAKQVKKRSFAREFKGTVKEILGTCVSIGCTVDGKSPKEVQAAIEEGEIEINE
jgi:large subunit ribosomal protein L12e